MTPDSWTVTGLAAYATLNPNPSFTATVTDLFSPLNPAPTQLYYQLDSTVGSWTWTPPAKAGANPASYSFQLKNVTPGLHSLFVYAVDGSDGTVESGGLGGVTRRRPATSRATSLLS